jgi:hypothetical protein
MENPYLTPPQVESPQSRSWGLGFLYGYQGPAQSSIPQSDVGAEDAAAFDQGVLAGQDAAINGLPLDSNCVDLNVERPDFLSLEVGSGVGEFVAAGVEFAIKKAVAGGILSMVLGVVELSMALETFSDDPAEALSEAAAKLQEQLTATGFTEPMTLFIGGGVDTNATGCELQLTPIFRDQENATSSVSALGRSQWLVVSWQTNQSGGATIVTSS